MTEIREIRPEDRAALVALWHQVFGDSVSFVEEFFRILPEIGSGVAAVENSVPVGAAYMITALELCEGERSRRCGYLYAVAVDPAARGRGLGGKLSQAAAALGRANGAELICTLPAEPGLYAWYEKLLGVRCALYRQRWVLDSRPGPEPQPLGAAEYARRREALLRGRPHLRLSEAAMRLEEANCRASGGFLCAVGDGIAAVYVNGDTAEIRELLGAPPEAAASLGAALGTKAVQLWMPAASGEPYLAFAPADLPENTVWNLAFD